MVVFQSTLPAWGATLAFIRLSNCCSISIHAPRMGSDDHQVTPLLLLDRISIHAPRMGSDIICSGNVRIARISIHAPRMGSDELIVSQFIVRIISIHAPRMGSDLQKEQHQIEVAKFQSTLPAWGATIGLVRLWVSFLFQSTLPAWGATSVLAPGKSCWPLFQSTLPAWGATLPRTV